MQSAIIDASIAVKWTVQEEHADRALAVLESCKDMAAPVHWLAEAANALWAKARKHELTPAQAEERAAALADAPVAPLPLDHLLKPAFAVAMRVGVTVYDALYLAAAQQRQCPLVTADRRLVDAAVNEGVETVWLPGFIPAAAALRQAGTGSRTAPTRR